MVEDLGTPEAPSNALEADFWKFHADNPQVYDLFDRFTRQSIAAGRQHFGVSVVIERIRWSTLVETAGGGEFKINNNYRAYYARLWMRNNPEHEGFFRTREVRHDDAA